MNIETLLLNGKASGFTEPFVKLKKLRVLDISGTNGFCNISVLHSHFFRYVPRINQLDLSNCHLHNIYRHVFEDLRSLINLDISYNQELTFRILKNVTSDLSSTNIKFLKMNKIHCTYGLGTEIYAADLMSLKNTSIQEIHMDSNRIQLLESKTLEQLPQTLHVVSAADNQFTMGKYAIEAVFMQNLKILDISRQHIAHIPNTANFNCNDHPHDSSKLCSSASHAVTNVKFNRTSLTNPVFEHHFTINNSYSDSNALPMSGTVFPLPINLVTCYFNMSAMRYSIPNIKLTNSNLKHVYLQDNALYEWIGPIENADSLELLDLSNNFCSSVSTFFFDYMIGLQHLKINDNILGFSIAKDKRGDTFKNLRNLRRLEMVSNKIQDIPEMIFQKPAIFRVS